MYGGNRYGEKVFYALLFYYSYHVRYVVNNDKGAFVEPTIFKNVPTSSPLYQEEVFGPVVIVNTFKTEEEALAEANGVEYGLFCTLSFFPSTHHYPKNKQSHH